MEVAFERVFTSRRIYLVKITARYAVLAAALSVFAASSARAQDDHKPGGLNKVARDVSKTVKKAGRDTKAEVKRGSSKTHNALTDAGNDTKTALKKTTGIKGSQSHQPGGLNKVARNVSKTFKKAGSDAKAEKNRAKSDIHGALTETGKSVKDTTLKGKP
jgi:ElaB/YqjD/DUF883 family membrane-anchored ribosome-binding protein